MISRLFERGLAYVGTDYLAHILWDKYIKFEMAQQAFSNVTAVYLRALSCPLKELDRYISRCFPSHTGLPTPQELPSLSNATLNAGTDTTVHSRQAQAHPAWLPFHGSSVLERWRWRR